MTVVLTGAAGWFGRAFLDLMASQGRTDVRALVRSPADVPVVTDHLARARVHVCDVTDPLAVAEAFEGLTQCRVVHAAAVIHPRRVPEFDRVNVDGTRNVLQAALDAGLTRFVHLSSNSAMGTNPARDQVFHDNEPYDPYLGYGRSKMLGELAVDEALRSAGVPGTVLRPPWFYGRFQPARQARFIRSVRTGRFPLVGDGGNRRSMVDVDRLASAAALALEADADGVRTYWVADAAPYSMTEILEAVRSAARAEGLPVRVGARRLPEVAGRVAQRIDRTLQARGLYQQEVHVAGELGETIACEVTGAVRDLGFSPATDPVEGMRRAIRWGRDHGQEL